MRPYACPACCDKRQHSPEELKTFHPFSGHGFTPETGWTLEDLKPKDSV